MQRLLLALACLVLVSGCSQTPTNNAQTSTPGPDGGSGGGVLNSLRAKADPEVLARMRAEEEERARQGDYSGMPTMDGGGAGLSTSAAVSALPQVSNAPFAPAADTVSAGPIITPVEQKPADQAPALPFWPFGPAPTAPSAPPAPPPVATYGGYGGGVPPPPPGGLMPPPPAVLSTSATPIYGDPYANPYANPYAQPQQATPRPNLFGGSGTARSSSDDDESSPSRKKNANFVPITPTGMEARSAYKQKDDLKMLWKGAIASSRLGQVTARDDKLKSALENVQFGLPPESSKGSINVSQRTIDTVFKPAPVDRNLATEVKKVQTEMAQAYYRYLYSYNKFALSQQTVQARKQEREFASTPSEQQRAAADLAQAQNEADSAKEDMRSAQQELASVAGAEAARSIIGRVSGVTPSAASLQVAESAEPAAPQGGGFLKAMGRFNPFAGGGQPKAAEEPQPKAAAKEVKGKKGKGGDESDLSPAPQTTASAPAAKPAPESPSGAPGLPIAFELKKVDITPRKSTLRVSIRNNGADSFTFDPEAVSISEGNRKLSEATVRAEFDTTLVAPNQEVTGTITIFGRPWNDRLSVALSEGGKNIQLKR